MRRIVPVFSAVALAGVISVPIVMSTSSVSASAPAAPVSASVPAEGPYCLPHVLPAPLNILEFYRDSYIHHLGQGQC